MSAVVLTFVKALPMFLESKRRRARAVYDLALLLDATAGQTVFGRGSHSSPRSRSIAVDRNTTILLHPGGTLKMRWVTASDIREVFECSKGSLLLEVLRFNEVRLQANIDADGMVELHRHVPGAWEEALGIDREGDTISLLPYLFADPDMPAFQAWLIENPRPAHRA